MTPPTKPQEPLHSFVSERSCQWGGSSPGWLSGPPFIRAFPGTMRRSCARNTVKIIPDPLPATSEQGLQSPNVSALKLLRLKSVATCLQCVGQASHPAHGACHLHELHSILSHSLVEGRACHEQIPEPSSPQ